MNTRDNEVYENVKNFAKEIKETKKTNLITNMFFSCIISITRQTIKNKNNKIKIKDFENFVSTFNEFKFKLEEKNILYAFKNSDFSCINQKDTEKKYNILISKYKDKLINDTGFFGHICSCLYFGWKEKYPKDYKNRFFYNLLIKEIKNKKNNEDDIFLHKIYKFNKYRNKVFHEDGSENITPPIDQDNADDLYNLTVDIIAKLQDNGLLDKNIKEDDTSEERIDII